MASLGADLEPEGNGYRGHLYSRTRYPPLPSYGAIRVQGAPGDAEVYVDGYYTGDVDDFDGTFQRLPVEPGPHRIEVVVSGTPVAAFEVNAQPGRTITVRP